MLGSILCTMTQMGTRVSDYLRQEVFFKNYSLQRYIYVIQSLLEINRLSFFPGYSMNLCSLIVRPATMR